jgi:hypothetical protein
MVVLGKGLGGGPASRWRRLLAGEGLDVAG